MKPNALVRDCYKFTQNIAKNGKISPMLNLWNFVHFQVFIAIGTEKIVRFHCIIPSASIFTPEQRTQWKIFTKIWRKTPGLLFISRQHFMDIMMSLKPLNAIYSLSHEGQMFSIQILSSLWSLYDTTLGEDMFRKVKRTLSSLNLKGEP